MVFLVPLALLTGTLALVVLAFHIRRRRNIAVPSLVIWRQLQAGQVRRNRVWQWPKPSWSLLLQLIAVLAMALALAQPLFNRGEAVDHWIYVVDRSGAMQANGTSGTLLDEAKTALETRLGAATGGGRQSLLAVGAATAPVAINQAMGAPGMKGAAQSIDPQDGPADWRLLGDTLKPLIRAGEATRIVIYSASAVDVPDLGDTVTIEMVAFSSDTPNAAITAELEAGDEPGAWTLSGVVRLDPGMNSADLVIGFAANGDEQPLEWSRRTMGDPDAEASETMLERSFSVDLDLPGAGIVSATLAADGNNYDNVARYVTHAAAQSLDVLYIGAGNQPLLSALRAIDGTQIFQAPRLPDDVAQYGLVVVDNSFVERQPETNAVFIGHAGIGAAQDTAETVLPPTAANAAHPVMRDVSWTGIEPGPSVALALDGEAEVLLRSNDQALIALTRSEQGRNLWLAFDPRDANWASQPSLPVFVANLVQWLGIAPGSALQASCEAGMLCQMDRRLEGGTATLLGAEGAVPQRIFDAAWTPDGAGLYALSKGTRRELIAVNPVVAPKPTPATSTEQADFPLPLWPFLLAIATVALLVEMIVSGRGSERFLVADGLRHNNPLSRRRRAALAIHLIVLGLAMAALLNLPVPVRQTGEALIAVLAPGSGPVDGALTSIGDENAERSGAAAANIALAAASVPWGEPGHIVVSGTTASDADVVGLAAVLAQRDIVLDTVAAAPNADPLYVAALEAPAPVFVDDTVPLVGIVHAATDMAATLRFERDGELLVEQQVALAAGDNRVETVLSEIAEGSAEYRLVVSSAADSSTDNNSLSRVFDARDAGQMAVIANDPARGAAFAEWLESQGIAATQIEPRRVPYRPRDWAQFDGTVLIDVPAIALTTLQQEQMESAVADQGMGLLILGGPNSFGPGGYLETPLDDASPLSSRVPRDAPEATLVFVLDRSGSMQQPVGNGTRLDIAKQATLTAIDLLNRNSQVGIIVFDSEPTTVLPLSRVDDPAAVSTALSSVDPGGGTSVYPGLEAAFDMLREVDSPARHIIVMTDGLSQPGDFPGLLGDIRAAGITVSSVSIGEGAERGLIEEIARLGGGAFHATDDFAALPSILSQEAMLLSGSPVETGTTQPLWASRDEPFLRGLPATMPPIDGFVLTTPKPAATLSMVAPDSKGEPMPLLASWRYGAGQVLALTTEAVGPWSPRWQTLDSYPPFWAQVVRQFLPGVEKGDLVLELTRQGDGIVADVTLRGEAIGAAPELSVAGGGEPLSLPLSRVGPNAYRASFYPDVAGIVRFDASAGEAAAGRSMAVNYPAYRGATWPDQAMRRLAILSGGQTDIVTPTARSLPERWSMVPAWPLWLALALALFMAELTIRYTRLLAPRPVPTTSRRPAPIDQTRSPLGEPMHT